MKIFILIIFLISNFNNYAYAKQWGRGELKLSKGTMQHLMMYMYGAGSPTYDHNKTKNKPSIFVVSEDGNWSYYEYCPYQRCLDSNQPQAIKICEDGSRGSPCKVMALERRIVWKNGNKKLRIKKKMLRDPISVASAIQEAGFYDGDIYKLAGIDYKTGELTEEAITGKIKKKKKNFNSNEDIVSQLKELKELLDSGAINQDEFKKLKKKILN